MRKVESKYKYLSFSKCKTLRKYGTLKKLFNVIKSLIKKTGSLKFSIILKF